MRYVLTNAQMREADGYTIDGLGVPCLTLMARAGEALYEQARALYENGKVLCVCGGGNNGGDGFYCAKRLKENGVETDVVFFAERTTAECGVCRDAFIATGGKILENVPSEGAYTLVVDCLWGTGFRGAPSEKYAAAISGINEWKKRGAKVLSADVPSGVGANGRASLAVQADKTLCLGELKTCVYVNDGIEYAGEVVRADIGIILPKTKTEYAFLSDKAYVSALLPKRRRNVHKGSFGRAAIVGGSAAYTGAPYLSAAACLRSGAGYTALFVPEEILPYYVLKAPEALLASVCEGSSIVFREKNFERLLGYDSVAYGMGAGVSEDVALGAEYLLTRYTGRLILDADALNSLAAYRRGSLAEIFAKKTCDVSITPHAKEFSRLSGKSMEEVVENGLELAKSFAKTHGLVVLLKGAVSVVTDGERTALNITGTSGQAKGGSGDVLAGVIAGLCAGGRSTFDGTTAGAWITGKAAELAVVQTGEYSLVATDVISYLGRAFLYLHGDQA